MDRWSMITPRTFSEFQYSNEKIRIESGIRWLFNGPGNGRYRSLPFPITIPFLVIAFFLFLPPSARILVSGTNRLFWHTFSLDYRDVDWLVEVFSSFLDGPSPIVAKVLIKSGRNCILGRFEDNPFLGLRAIRKAGKAGGRPPPGIREREGILSVSNPNFFSLEIDREMFSKRMFLEHPSSPPIPWNTWEEGDRSWKSTVCVSRSCVLFTTRVSPLWKKRNFEVIGIVPYLLREEAVQLSDSSIFPRVRLANSDKESLSLSLNLPPN